MQKSTLYIITLFAICFVVLGVFGEYFSYQYFSGQQLVQSSQTLLTSTPQQTATPGTQKSGSSENLILSFNLQNPLAVGSVDQSSYSVTVTVPPDTDVTKLAPQVQISPNATISPASDSPQDFTNPVDYTVTAQNGATQKYAVTVNVASITKSVSKLIESFTLSGFKPEVDGYIDNDNFTVTAVVPDGTDLTKITPIIGISDGSSISPNSNVEQNFTNPVIYTLTDIYGTTQKYSVTVVTVSNSG